MSLIFKRNLKQIYSVRTTFLKSSRKNLVRPAEVSEKLTLPGHIIKPIYWEHGITPPKPKLPEIKNEDQISRLKASCSIASNILKHLESFIKVGVTTDEIDKEVHNLCIENGAYPSPLNYGGFPKSCCTSVNNVACHGIPDSRPLEDGDIINVDVTVYKDGMHGDCSRMYLIGNVDKGGQKLCDVAKSALDEAINICAPGVPYCKIGEKIEKHVKSKGLTVIPCFVGHGIGSYFHGPPDIYHHKCEPAYIQGNMKPGVSFTIEPVVGEGDVEIEVQDDGWTALTVDDSRSAQWEETVLITPRGVEILTR